jgi:hypothetical protein
MALRLRPGRPLVACYLLTSVCALEPLLLVRPFPALVIAGATLLAMLAIAVSKVLWLTTLQQRVPREAISRVSAYEWLGSLIFLPAGLALAGPLAGAIGTDATLWLSGTVLLATNVGILAVPSVRAIRRPEPGAEPNAEPVLPLRAVLD